MQKIVGTLSLLALMGCVSGSGEVASGAMSVADLPLPPEVEAAIPADLRLSDVLVQDGCYYYRSGGQTYPVVTMFMRENGMGNQPFCVG